MINKRSKSLEKVNNKIESQKPVLNPEVEKNILSSREDTYVLRDPGRRLGGRIDNSKDDFSAVVPKQILEKQKRDLGFERKYLTDKEKESEKEINTALESGRDKYIRYGKDAGIDSLSHEFGHLKNIDNKYPKDELENNRDVIKDERQASKNAIGILKKAGATKKEIKQSKKNLRDFEKTYRLVNKGAIDKRDN